MSENGTAIVRLEIELRVKGPGSLRDLSAHVSAAAMTELRALGPANGRAFVVQGGSVRVAEGRPATGDEGRDRASRERRGRVQARLRGPRGGGATVAEFLPEEMRDGDGTWEVDVKFRPKDQEASEA